MKFIIDAQLPPAFARWLTSLKYGANHVEDFGMREAEDTPIWRYAIEHDAIIITKDEDFAIRARQNPNGPVVIWLRVGNCSRRALIDWFGPLLPDILSAISEGQKLIEVR